MKRAMLLLQGASPCASARPGRICNAHGPGLLRARAFALGPSLRSDWLPAVATLRIPGACMSGVTTDPAAHARAHAARHQRRAPRSSNHSASVPS